MKKVDIVDDIYKKIEKLGYTNREIARVLDSVFDTIKEIVQRDELMISGFGSFYTKNKRARPGRNPRTGSYMEISPRRVLRFKPSRVLIASLNRPTGEIEAEQKAKLPG